MACRCDFSLLHTSVAWVGHTSSLLDCFCLLVLSDERLPSLCVGVPEWISSAGRGIPDEVLKPLGVPRTVPEAVDIVLVVWWNGATADSKHQVKQDQSEAGTQAKGAVAFVNKAHLRFQAPKTGM